MNQKIITVTLFITSLFAIIMGYFLLHPELFMTCPARLYSNCIAEFWSEGIASPLYWGLRWLPPLFFVLIFVRPEIFRAWWKVILPLSIVALLLICISPPLPDFYTPDRTNVTERMVWLIEIVSAFVIGWKYWRLSRRISV